MGKSSEVVHRLSIIDRKSVSLSGVSKVQSFDPKEIVLETIMGALNVKGEDLGIKLLDLENGQVEIEGKVDSLTYPKNSKGARQNIWNKIFR